MPTSAAGSAGQPVASSVIAGTRALAAAADVLNYPGGPTGPTGPSGPSGPGGPGGPGGPVGQAYVRKAMGVCGVKRGVGGRGWVSVYVFSRAGGMQKKNGQAAVASDDRGPIARDEKSCCCRQRVSARTRQKHAIAIYSPLPPLPFLPLEWAAVVLACASPRREEAASAAGADRRASSKAAAVTYVERAIVIGRMRLVSGGGEM